MLELIKKLRKVTGAGLADCKAAMTAAKGNIDDATIWLRKNVMSIAKKKISSRDAQEGLVAIYKNGNQYSIIEVNAETDFVARNEKFQDFVIQCVKANKFSSIDDLHHAKLESGENIQDAAYNISGIIGEKIVISRCDFLQADNVEIYMHNKVKSSLIDGNNDKDCILLGKIGVIVELSCQPNDKKLGHSIAMHIAAYTPEAICVEDIDPAIIEKEREVISGFDDIASKPDHIKENIIKGRLVKFSEELSLTTQAWIKNPKVKVSHILNENAVSVNKFILYKLS